ncbi:MAG: hypothetical protein HC886_00610 [Leptolyngbyaceae cyanobacterium SM1_1_3]|nr:hypothetical protein [Leptolyngbyaceae cyanobacterium SM1_1_3]
MREQNSHSYIYGIITNGEGWKFYRLALSSEVFESLLYGIGKMSILLELLQIFLDCAIATCRVLL